MKTYCIGDVHGAGLELEELLNTISPASDDSIILVGDLFDRGLHSVRVWELIKRYRIKCLCGNHEYKMRAYLRAERNFLPGHYYIAMNLLVKSGVSPSELLSFLEDLPMLIEYEDFIAVHGGIRLDNPSLPDVSANVYGSLQPDHLMQKNSDKSYWWDMYDRDKLVVYGHLSSPDCLPRIRKNTIGKINSVGLDTAAVHSGPLTAICIEDMKFYSYCSSIDWASKVKSACKSNFPTIHPDIKRFISKDHR